MMYPIIRHTMGAMIEIMLLDFLACTEVAGLTVAVGLVSAITMEFN
jgi:hypothetical protein